MGKMSLDFIKSVKPKSGRCIATLHCLIEHVASHIHELRCFYIASGLGLSSACDLMVQDLLIDKDVYVALQNRQLQGIIASASNTGGNTPINSNYVLMHELLTYVYAMSTSETNFHQRIVHFLMKRGSSDVLQRYVQCPFHQVCSQLGMILFQWK